MRDEISGIDTIFGTEFVDKDTGVADAKAMRI
jgi:hypothetical protein